MGKYSLDDTIVAIATPVGTSGIGIVRMSGEDSLKIADKIFVSKDGKKPSSFRTYTVHYGWIVNPNIIDEVLLTVMRSPRSYTKEDVVEINCHGGIVALRQVLELVLESGARLAEPGEFTKRAFLNGRIDLAQAEAVLDIIKARTAAALKIGSEQLRGGLSSQMQSVRATLLGLLAALEARIDFPEEELGSADLHDLSEKLSSVFEKIKGLLDSSRKGRLLREGVQVVICGKPNTGKSSLLNALLKQERSIVTPVAGTTRDTIEETIDMQGIPVRLVDTAGIIEPRDLVERRALLRSKRWIALADLAILLFDGHREFSQEDAFLIRKLRNKPTIAAINKIDLKQKIKKEILAKKFGRVIEISAKKKLNIGLLEDSLVKTVMNGSVTSPESAIVSNFRHIELLKKMQKSIECARNSLDNKLPIEFVAQDLKEAVSCVEGLLGVELHEDLLDRIFSEFCIGK